MTQEPLDVAGHHYYFNFCETAGRSGDKTEHSMEDYLAGFYKGVYHQIEQTASWIRENISDHAAVDFLKDMGFTFESELEYL